MDPVPVRRNSLALWQGVEDQGATGAGSVSATNQATLPVSAERARWLQSGICKMRFLEYCARGYEANKSRSLVARRGGLAPFARALRAGGMTALQGQRRPPSRQKASGRTRRERRPLRNQGDEQAGVPRNRAGPSYAYFVGFGRRAILRSLRRLRGAGTSYAHFVGFGRRRRFVLGFRRLNSDCVFFGRFFKIREWAWRSQSFSSARGRAFSVSSATQWARAR